MYVDPMTYGGETVRITRGEPYGPPWPDELPDVIVPLLVLGYESTSSAQHIFHDVIGAPSPAVSLRHVSTRSGTLELFFLNDEYSFAAEQFLRVAGVYYLRADHPSMDLAFVPSGLISRTLDPETRKRWILRVEYREVTP